jgi:hypothetical protein
VPLLARRNDHSGQDRGTKKNMKTTPKSKALKGEKQQKEIDKNVKGIHEYNKKHPLKMNR